MAELAEASGRAAYDTGGQATSSAGLVVTAQPSTSQPSLRCTCDLNFTFPRCMMAATSFIMASMLCTHQSTLQDSCISNKRQGKLTEGRDRRPPRR